MTHIGTHAVATTLRSTSARPTHGMDIPSIGVMVRLSHLGHHGVLQLFKVTFIRQQLTPSL